ncbi:MAG: hypothetical protein OHK0046_21050 [Anaerolineae bacterium]
MMKRVLLLLLIGFLVGSQAQAQDDLLGRINNLRSSLGLHGYTYNGALAAAAQNQASWMAATGQISHTQPDGSTPSSRAVAAGYPSSAVSENIYMGTSATAATAWEWWLNSPIHYRGITNAVYTEVGIGSASGEQGTAFVLVFGNPSGWRAPANTIASTGGGGSAGLAAQPSFVVGVDNFGNIMHEIQPGQTLGDIALIYGYEWDDLETIRGLNSMNEEQGRQLSIGAILLVPPQAGTYTPTPGDPPTITPSPETSPTTEDAATLGEAGPPVLPSPTFTPDAAFVSVGALLRQSATPDPAQPSVIEPAVVEPAVVDPAIVNPAAGDGLVSPTAAPLSVATSAAVPEWVVMTADADLIVGSPTPGAVAWQAATMTPTPQSVAMLIEPAVVDMTEERTAESGGGGVSPLVVIAVVLQVAVLSFAGFQLLRRK